MRGKEQCEKREETEKKVKDCKREEKRKLVVRRIEGEEKEG